MEHPRILLVSAEPAAVTSRLDTSSFLVMVVPTIQEALLRVGGAHPDAVLVDSTRDQPDPIAGALHLRERLPGRPVIALLPPTDPGQRSPLGEVAGLFVLPGAADDLDRALRCLLSKRPDAHPQPPPEPHPWPTVSLTHSAASAADRRFQILFENAADALFVHDLDGNFVMVNRRACESLGYGRAELLTKNVLDVEMSLKGVDFKRMAANFVPGVFNTLQGVHRRKDGQTFPVEVRVGLFELDGQAHVMAMARDVGQRHAMEVQLREAQKMEAIGRLAGGVAHDFNNILTVILSHAEFLLDDLADNELTRADAVAIREAGRRAATLTHQLLAIGRRNLVDPQVVHLQDVIVDMEDLLRQLLGVDRELITQIAQDIPAVLADPSQLEQVVLNLVVNARDAMPVGGRVTVELFTERRTQPLEVTVPGPGKYVVLRVTDTGNGIADHVLPHIFEPFFTTRREDSGTGLGLATVYSVVRQSGGHIRVDSQVGTGTCFTVHLPVHDALPASASLPPPSLGRSGEVTETILVTDDQEQVLMLVSRALRRKGYKMLLARNAGEALLLLERYKGTIDLLLTDVVMPHMSGAELARRAADFRPEMKILFMSGYADDELVPRGLADVVRNLLRKPFTPAELANRVRVTLDTATEEGA